MGKYTQRKSKTQYKANHRNPEPLDLSTTTDFPDIQKGPEYLKNNTDVQDFLEEDPIINGQELVLMSFATLGETQRKEVYKQMATTELDALIKSASDTEDVVESVVEAWLECNKYKRGIKIRGAFPNTEQGHASLKKRIEFLKKTMLENYHVFVAEMGKWCPFDADPDDIEAQEYSEAQLNTMMKEHKLANEKANLQFQERKRDMMSQAMLDGTPEGQQMMMEKEEPIEAVQQRIEGAQTAKKELLEKIEEMNRIQELAEKKLEYLNDRVTIKEI